MCASVQTHQSNAPSTYLLRRRPSTHRSRLRASGRDFMGEFSPSADPSPALAASRPWLLAATHPYPFAIAGPPRHGPDRVSGVLHPRDHVRQGRDDGDSEHHPGPRDGPVCAGVHRVQGMRGRAAAKGLICWMVVWEYPGSSSTAAGKKLCIDVRLQLVRFPTYRCGASSR